MVNSLVNLKGVAKLFSFRDFQFLFSINLTGLAILLEGFFFVFFKSSVCNKSIYLK